MTTHSVDATKVGTVRKHRLSMSARRRLLRIFASVVMTVYAVLTLFPFYALFIRSFVSTKDFGGTAPLDSEG